MPDSALKVSSDLDLTWMSRALDLAQKAADMGEVPVGAVLLDEDGKVLGEGFNAPISSADPTSHAEINALRQAADKKGNYRLPGTTLYVTLEPCVMCAGAIIHARVERLVFGAFDPKAGAVNSVYDVLSVKRLNHQLIFEGGVMEEACSALLKDFFKPLRNTKT